MTVGDEGKAPRPEDGEGGAGPAQHAQPYRPAAYFGDSGKMRPKRHRVLLIICRV